MYASFDAGRRVIIGDLGDNTNAGASGDVPYACRQLLQAISCPRPEGGAQPRVLIAGLVDASAVAVCAKALAGGVTILPQLRVGAAHAVGASFGDGCEPLELSNVTLRGMVNGGAWAVIDLTGEARASHPTMTLVLQRSAWAFFGRGDIERLTPQFHPSEYDVVIVKRGN
eukprot:2341227-Prymnesium_polylepis.1